jgi:hypothetical protein
VDTLDHNIAVHMSDNPPAYVNWRIAYNSSNGVLDLSSKNGQNIEIVGNIARVGDWQCQDAIYSHNVWFGAHPARCSSSDIRAVTARFVDDEAGNLRLLPSSPAVDRGDPRDYPRTDIDGRRRPLGRAPDAGATEVR